MWWLFAIILELKNTEQIEETSKIKNNIKIGIWLGIVAFTKQNIGVFACIATLCIATLKKLFDPKEKFIKEILAKACGVLLVVLAMLVYFIATNSFYSFVDYCVGGLFEFGKENVYLKFPINYLLVLLLVGVGLFLSIKKKDKKIMILTMLQVFVCTLSYPISNSYHVALSMITLLPLFVIIRENIKNEDVKDIMNVLFLFLILFVPVSNAVREYSGFENLFSGESMISAEIASIAKFMLFMAGLVTFIMQKEKVGQIILCIGVVFLFSTQCVANLYIRKGEIIPFNMEIYTGLGCSDEVLSYIEDVLSFIEAKRAENKEVIVVSVDAAYYMASLKENNYIYDLPLMGCLGFEGEERLINNLNIDKNTIVLKNEQMMNQESIIFDKYIKENCVNTGKIRDLNIYEKKN